MAKARIKLFSTDIDKVNDICNQIIEIAKKVKIEYAGPISLPTKHMEIPVRKSPDGEGSSTWDRWEMRIHKRMIDIDADERALHQVMKVSIPKDVNIEIRVIE
jgi:small subunit ribosomal protein S10